MSSTREAYLPTVDQVLEDIRAYAAKYAIPGAVVMAMFRCGIYANEALRPSWAVGQVRGEADLEVLAVVELRPTSSDDEG